MTRKEWIAPGILITVLTIGANFISAWAVDRYRNENIEGALKDLKSEVREQYAKTDKRIDQLDSRLMDMSKSATAQARLEEKYENMRDRINELQAVLKEQEGRAQARYDSLSTRLARAGF